MSLITLDFESFYDSDYSLSKMTTEEYIRNTRFQSIGFSIKHGAAPAEWFSGDHAYQRKVLGEVDWSRTAMLGHNNRFDAAILNWIFGYRPKMYLDTMSMARGLVGLATSCSLAKLGEYFALPMAKGHEVVNAKGKRLEDFTPGELAAYGSYCRNDTEMCYLLAQILMPQTLTSELQLQDWTIRAYVEPRIMLDRQVLDQELAAYHARKNTMLHACGILDVQVLRSDDALARILDSMGVSVPTKLSPKQKNPDGTPKRVWAFSKQDIEFMDLLEDEDERVVAVVEARLGTKSSIVQSRLERLVGISNRGPMPAPMVYAGATPTRRWSGDDNINIQNFPRNKLARDAENKPMLDPVTGEAVIIPSPLRRALTAPAGYRMAAADLSQIELRVNAWHSGQHDVLELLRAGGDVYSDQATALYGYEVTKKTGKTIHQVERFVGKTTELQCLAGGTLVLTNNGAKPIVSVSKDDKLWDGYEWVTHDGLVLRGRRVVQQWAGVDATADHQTRGWSRWALWSAATESIRFRALATLRASWSLLGMPRAERRWLLSNASAAAAAIRTQASRTGGEGGAHVAPRAPALQETWRGPRSMSLLAPVVVCMRSVKSMVARLLARVLVAVPSTKNRSITSTGSGEQPAAAAPVKAQPVGASRLSPSTSGARGTTCAPGLQGPLKKMPAFTLASLCATDGSGSRNSRLTQFFCRVGAALSVVSFSIAGIVRAATTPAIAGGSTPRRVLETYDLANAGPRNQFSIVTAAGLLVVHNCGYQCGPAKFIHSLKVAAKRDGIALPDTSELFGQRIVGGYREKRAAIRRFWYIAGDGLEKIAYGMEGSIGRYPIKDGRLWLPNGSYLYYPELRFEEKQGEGEQGCEWVYSRYQKGRKIRKKIYGGLLTENITQAVARLFVSDALLRLDGIRYPDGERVFHVIFSVHDELVVLYRDHLDEQYVRDTLEWAMTTNPGWAPDLPLACEIGIGDNYSDCK